ncbi:hypothetical protein [Bradyrhizobium sp. th.b2]|nr:hypothetical protein [Bradyrhizobium sp. th.b2]
MVEMLAKPGKLHQPWKETAATFRAGQVEFFRVGMAGMEAWALKEVRSV